MSLWDTTPHSASSKQRAQASWAAVGMCVLKWTRVVSISSRSVLFGRKGRSRNTVTGLLWRGTSLVLVAIGLVHNASVVGFLRHPLCQDLSVQKYCGVALNLFFEAYPHAFWPWRVGQDSWQKRIGGCGCAGSKGVASWPVSVCVGMGWRVTMPELALG